MEVVQSLPLLPFPPTSLSSFKLWQICAQPFLFLKNAPSEVLVLTSSGFTKQPKQPEEAIIGVLCGETLMSAGGL